MRTLTIKAMVVTGIAVFAVAMRVFAAQPRHVGVRAGRADENYLDSRKCLACHENHHASWARTHHSRMTQEARPGTVQGDFERENRFEYLGVRAAMSRQGETFSMTLDLPDGRRQVFPIDRTVGSRRIEQYLSKQENGHVRLPLAYDLINRRWMSLNGSFFHADGENFFQHQTQWDSNCVFCHNVKAQPMMNPRTRGFETEVTELGIACGACHGSAAAHVEAAASPLTRARWRFDEGEDRRIVQPERLSPERSMMICGHCHGQRIPEPMDRIQEIMRKGDPYNAGDDLARFYRPVTRETRIGEFSFANRFWNDGSPRLTAYEYQGVLRSACFTKGTGPDRIQCLTCHTMHDGDPKGQIRPENRGDKPCLSCHQQYAPPAALTAHTRHGAESAGSRCYNCHMPRVVYGVMSIHPTHEITVPDPSRTAAAGVPNACTQCHLDKSVNWAIAATSDLWPKRFAGQPKSKDAQFDQPEGARALFAGDALTRALAAEALAGGGPGRTDPQWARPLLVEAFADNYPIVRFFAAQGLAADSRAPRPDYLAPASTRQTAYERWWSLYPTRRQATAELAALLRAKRVNVDLEVGE
ncbi:MAG: cytochrome c3 family protein [Blastocatellia bacterium]|nr:cytochrome c3 family protein [Blastocatellia bacterium]